jgi:hypothetical protein
MEWSQFRSVFLTKPYESPAEYNSPNEDNIDEFVFKRQKPDKPESFEDKVGKERERLDSEKPISDK